MNECSEDFTMMSVLHIVFFSFVLFCICLSLQIGWLRGTEVERWSLAGELSLSFARPAADTVTTCVGKPSAIGQPTRPTKLFILSRSINYVVVSCN